MRSTCSDGSSGKSPGRLYDRVPVLPDPVAGRERHGDVRDDLGAMASVHSSLTQWKNVFSFEVFGEDGYLNVEGLGASYGTEKLIAGRRDFSAPFQDIITEYRGGDISSREEWKEFRRAIAERREPIGNGHDGLAAMHIALSAYQSEKAGRFATIA